jgi:tetratricopeptide (TPR) repeat protein
MNGEPKNIWKSRLTGWRKLLAWIGLLAILTVLLAFILDSVYNWKEPTAALLAMAATVVILGALLGWLTIRLIRWLCCWRNFRRFLIGVAGFITLIFLAYAVENWRGKHAWETHKQQWEAEGEKFSIAQLAPPPVPDDQNFAMTPLLKPLLDFTRGPNGTVWRDTNGLARLEGIGVELEDKGKTNHLALGNLEKGTFADLAACQEFYRGHTNYPQPAVPGTAAADILVALGKFDPEIKELREAAATRPYSRFPVEYQYEPSWAILLPHLAPVKRLCQVTHVRALAHLELGQSPEALVELKLGLRLSDSIRDEPILISHFVRIAMMNFNLQTLREGLIRHAWSEAQLADIEKYLSSVDLLAECKLALRGERVFSTSGLDWLRRQGFRADTSIFTDMGGEEPSFAKVMAFMPGGWYYQNMLTMSEMFQEFNLPMVDEKTHRVFPDIAAKSDAAVNNYLGKGRPKPYNLIARKLMPALGTAIHRSAQRQTSVDAARVACALERYRLANGKLPETLDALSPRFLESIPTAVIDGQPLRYRLKPDGGYVVYSVGWNQTDDGGEIAWKNSYSKAPSVDITKGDWVWQMPAK